MGFLLRFQEAIGAAATADPSVKTKTAVKCEQADHGVVFPLAGTKTITEIKREEADQDPKPRLLYALPR